MDNEQTLEHLGNLFAEITMLINSVLPRLNAVFLEVESILPEILDTVDAEHPANKEYAQADESSRKLAYLLTFGPN